MIGWLELVVVAAVFLYAIRALFRVQCPRGKALVITRGSADEAGAASSKAFRVLASGSATRLPWSDAVDTIDLSVMRFDVFVPWGTPSREVHATAELRVSTRERLLRRAALRLLGAPARDIDALGETLLELTVRDALAGRASLDEDDTRKEIEGDVLQHLEPIAEELGLEVDAVRVKCGVRKS